MNDGKIFENRLKLVESLKEDLGIQGFEDEGEGKRNILCSRCGTPIREIETDEIISVPDEEIKRIMTRVRSEMCPACKSDDTLKIGPIKRLNSW